MTRRRGFSVIELLTAVMIFVILGGAVFTSLWLFWGSYYSDRDYVTAREEIEYAFQVLGRDVTNISVGMPNNRSTSGDFSESFRGPDASGSDSPAMFYMGQLNAEWGGPILLRWHLSGNPDYTDFSAGQLMTTLVKHGDTNVYVGTELLYAAGIPAWGTHKGVRSVLKVNADVTGRFASGINVGSFTLMQENGVQQLVDFTESGRDAGIRNTTGTLPTNARNPRAWMLLPGLQLPLLVNDFDAGTNRISAQIAPYSGESLAGTLGGFEEIYLVKAARVFVDENHRLVQEIFGDDFNIFASPTAETASTSTVRVLAEHIAGVVFFFDPIGRTLTMHLAAFGSELDPVGGGAGGVQPAAWPQTDNSTANSNINLPTGLLNRRIILGSRVWRIRN